MKFNMLRLDEKSFSPQKCYSPSNFLQLHLLLTFSCFSNPNLLNHFLHPLALIRTPFYSRVDCHGNYNICNIWPISYKNILRLNFPNCKDIYQCHRCASQNVETNFEWRNLQGCLHWDNKCTKSILKSIS